MIIIEMPGYTVELDERVIHPACAAVGMDGPWEYSSPAEDAEIEYVGARLVRNGRTKEINPANAVIAIKRRLGEDWRRC